jgi:hypothetical protein
MRADTAAIRVPSLLHSQLYRQNTVRAHGHLVTRAA